MATAGTRGEAGREPPGAVESWSGYLDLQLLASDAAIEALAMGRIPSWPAVRPPSVAASPADRDRAVAVAFAVQSVLEVAQARQTRLAVTIAGLAHPRGRTAAAVDPTLGAGLDIRG